MAISKVEFDGQTLIDISNDTVAAGTLLQGETAHGSNGELVTGTCDYDVNSTESTNPITAGDVKSGKVGFVNGAKVTGAMANATANIRISDRDDNITIPQGYHAGTSNVRLDSTARGLLVPGNLRDGVTILGQTGNYVAPSGWVDLSTLGLHCELTKYNSSSVTGVSGAKLTDVAITIGFQPKVFLIKNNVAVRTTDSTQNKYWLTSSFTVVDDNGHTVHYTMFDYYNSSFRVNGGQSKNIYFAPTANGVQGTNTSSSTVYMNTYQTGEYVWWAWG